MKFFEVELVTVHGHSHMEKRGWFKSDKWVQDSNTLEAAGKALIPLHEVISLSTLLSNPGDLVYGQVWYNFSKPCSQQISKSSYDALREELLKESGL